MISLGSTLGECEAAKFMELELLKNRFNFSSRDLHCLNEDLISYFFSEFDDFCVLKGPYLVRSSWTSGQWILVNSWVLIPVVWECESEARHGGDLLEHQNLFSSLEDPTGECSALGLIGLSPGLYTLLPQDLLEWTGNPGDQGQGGGLVHVGVEFADDEDERSRLLKESGVNEHALVLEKEGTRGDFGHTGF